MSDSNPTLKRKLGVGDTVLCHIEARLKWNDTGIEVMPQECYRFEATGQWFDASIRTGPAGYVSNRWFFRMTERFRRMPDENWFALIGAIGQDQSSAFLVGQDASVPINSAGILNFFANDLPLFYGNNSGAIGLKIVRET